MSIFGIIGTTFLIALACALIVLLIFFAIEPEGVLIPTITVVSVGLIMWLGGVFIGIGLTTRDEKVYVKQYLAQKYTIEESLKNDSLTGLERIQLVNKATELNGELAGKKARFEMWDFVTYDNTIYDNVELIVLQG